MALESEHACRAPSDVSCLASPHLGEGYAQASHSQLSWGESHVLVQPGPGRHWEALKTSCSGKQREKLHQALQNCGFVLTLLGRPPGVLGEQPHALEA